MKTSPTKMLAAIFDHPQTPLVNNLGMEYQTAASKHVLKRTRSLRRPDERVKRKRKKESSRSSDGLPMRCVIPRIADVSKENSEMWKLAEIKGPSHCRCLRLPDNLSILREVHMSIPLLISYFTENQSLASVVSKRTWKMAAKNVVQRMDSMEEVVSAVQEELHREMGTLKEEMQNMNK
ncbi:hypothetical protein HHK36_021418 [Tetracentron sinense]|uniref:Uncharacterized protein n=1 Tax=Tetracentron sinense TaxID=13715 RepID=A0A834YRF9_TETSI|nr:hypothetical protein HHK36_021418 [Tetracentron sinense]